MPIQRGEDWGDRAPLPVGAPVLGSDADLARAVRSAAAAGPSPWGPYGLVGGDLCHTLGGRGREARLRSPDAVRVACDSVVAVLDGTVHRFVAHLVARHLAWHGPTLVVMNAAWLGSWNLGPRAHPGDGLVDVTYGALPWRQRHLASTRARAGDHLPHPALTTVRRARYTHEFARPTPVLLDGQRVGRARRIEVQVDPASVLVVV